MTANQDEKERLTALKKALNELETKLGYVLCGDDEDDDDFAKEIQEKMWAAFKAFDDLEKSLIQQDEL